MLVVKSKIVNVKNNYKIISIEYSKPFTINFVGSLLTTYANELIIFGALTLSTFLQNLSNKISTFTLCNCIYNNITNKRFYKLEISVRKHKRIKTLLFFTS